MNTWQIKKLGEITTYFNDGNWIESDDQSISGIRLIQTGNIGLGYFIDRAERARFITEETFGRLNCTEIFEGDVLISRLPDPVGRSCLLPKLDTRAITAVDCTIARFPNKLLAKYFLYYSLTDTYLNEIKRYLTGSSRVRISRSNLGKINVILPANSIQKQIVERMDKIVEARKLNDELIQKADELFQSLLHKELNPIGKNWEVKKLGDIANFINGKAFKPRDWEKEGLPIIRIQNLNNINAEFNYYKNPVEEKYLVHDGDLLLSWSGNLGTSFGAFVWNRGDGLLNQHIFNVKIKDNSLDNSFFYFAVNKIIKEIENKTHGIIGLVHITKGTLEKIKIPLPSFETQKQIVAKLSAAREYKKRILEQKLKLKELFDSVLHHAFQGHEL